MTSLAALPLDVLDQVMSSLFDFRTLRACIHTCTTLHQVYDAHPNSILQSVAINLLGSRALVNAAWRSILVDRQLDENSAAFQHDDGEWIQSQLRSVASAEVGDITWAEARNLEERARVCREMEIIYSLNYKDKLTAEISRLSADESGTFRMALLRLWYILSIINSGDSARAAFDEFEARDAIFYSRLSNQELYELQVVVFWIDLEMDSLGIDIDAFGCLAAIGLKGFLEVYRTKNFDLFSDNEGIELDWMFDDDFNALWQDRKVEPFDIRELPVSKEFKPLLETRIGLDDACTKCETVLGLDLYSCRNWVTKRAIQFETTSNLSDYFPGGLTRNVYERQMFKSYVENPLSDCAPDSRNDPLLSVVPIAAGAASTAAQANSIAMPSATAVAQPIAKFDILNALFHLDTIITDGKLQELLAQDGYADIEPDDWLCHPCLNNLLRSRLWIWWYTRRPVGGLSGVSCGRTAGMGMNAGRRLNQTNNMLGNSIICVSARTQNDWPPSGEISRSRPSQYPDS